MNIILPLEKLVNATAIITDENDVGGFIDRAANLKAIITGDVFSVNRKYKPVIDHSFRGFMVQCLNEMPRIKDKTDVPYTKSNKDDNGHGKRRLKLNSKAVEVLKEQRMANPFGEYVFVGKNGFPLWTNKINQHLKDFCKAAGIRYLFSHSIRVSGITSLYDCGVAPTKIQIAARHSDIRTTNGYCRSEICDEISLDILEKAL